jgi:cytoskeletal protein CcmA (bactofilin family)
MSLFGGRRDSDQGEPGEVPISAPTPRPAAPAVRTKSSVEGDREMANIGKSISIKGDLSGNEDLVIEGKVEGKVDLPNNQLTIGANRSVKAEVKAKTVIVVGKVAGNVNGTERIEIQATGVVDGDVTAPRLVVAEGAVVNGSIQMTGKPGAAGTAGAQPAAAAHGAEAVRKVG